MKSFCTIIEVKYSEPAEQFVFLNSLIEDISDKTIKGNLGINGIFEINLKDRRAKIIVESNRIALSIEKELDNEEVVKIFEVIFQKIQKKLTFNKISRIGIRTLRLKDMGMSFENLVKKFKDVFLKKTSIIEDSFDVSIPLTIKNGNNIINFVAGPMEREQYINQFSQIKDGKDVPERFIFIDIDFSATPNKTLSKEEILDFINKGFDYGDTKSQEVFNLLK